MVNFQEQIDLQKTNLITPEYVLNSGTTLDTSKVSYNQMNDTNLNAADKINLANNKYLSNIFSHSEGCPFCLVHGFLCYAKAVKFN